MALLSAKGARSKLIGGGGVDLWEQLVPQVGGIAQLEQSIVVSAQLAEFLTAENLWI